MRAGVLRGDGALELRDRCLQLPAHQISGIMDVVAGFENASTPRVIFDLARLDWTVMMTYQGFLDAASAVIDSSLSALEPAEAPSAVDITAFHRAIDRLLTRLQHLLTDF